MKKLSFAVLVIFLVMGLVGNAVAIEQKRGATGVIVRMIVNHNADADEIYITTDDPAPNCSEMRLRSDNLMVSEVSFQNLYKYLLVAKLLEIPVDFWVGPDDCLIFRAEMFD